VTAPVAIAFGFDDGVKPPRGILDTPYNFTFKGRNGCPPYTFVFQNGSLPPGLSMSTDGVISGLPTMVGRYSFWVELRDTGCTGFPGNSCPPVGTSCSFPSQRPFTIDISAPLSIAAPALIVTENNVPVSHTTVHGKGGRAPYTWQLARAPDWLIIGNDGAMAGTPRTPGSFRLTVALTDQYDDRATAETRLVVKARLAITTTELRPAKMAHVYHAPLHTNGGVAPLHWNVTAGRLPMGLRLNTSTGLIAGTPHKAGSYSIRVRVKDKLGLTTTMNLTLIVHTASKLASV